MTTQVISPDGNVVDIYSQLLSKRIIFLNDEVNNQTANIIKSQLLYLNTISNEDISIYIDSPGGSVYTGMGILDVMDFVTADIKTVNIGLAASMAAVILAYGTPGKRKSLKRSKTMIHQPISEHYGQASDLEISTNEVLNVKNELLGILAEKTGKSEKKIKNDSDRDYWMTAEQALKYGMIDEII